MAHRSKIFIGVAWPYVNGDLHIGHLAGYLLPADIFARFHRFLGNEVLMVSGSDCYGTPITVEADKRGVPPEKIVDEYHPKNVKLFRDLRISFDLYTKTTTENHIRTAQDVFLRLLEQGYIFKSETKQYYSLSENRFLPDRYVEGTCLYCGFAGARGDQCDSCGKVLGVGDLKDPKSRNGGATVTLKKTEHYFIDLQKFQPILENYVKEKSGLWRPWVRKETEGWLRRGLTARPITRDITWGVPIPVERIPEDKRIADAEQKRIYVWFEAVVGYLSASIEWAMADVGDRTTDDRVYNPDKSDRSNRSDRSDRWREFWYNPEAEHYYFMGKDNLFFHTLLWPAELFGYDKTIHLPDVPAINQFLNLEGQKFSKSRGITVDSREIVETYGLDPVRFYLASIMPESADANFSWADFVRTNNDILIATIGNFINRTLTLAKDIQVNQAVLDAAIKERTEKILKQGKTALLNCEFQKYVSSVVALADFGNKYLAEREPWKYKNGDRADRSNRSNRSNRSDRVIVNALYVVVAEMLLIKPLLIDAYDKLSGILGVRIDAWKENETELLENLLLRISISPGAVKPLFRKIELK